VDQGGELSGSILHGHEVGLDLITILNGDGTFLVEKFLFVDDALALAAEVDIDKIARDAGDAGGTRCPGSSLLTDCVLCSKSCAKSSSCPLSVALLSSIFFWLLICSSDIVRSPEVVKKILCSQ
jgi:hypothetical protein